MMVGVEWLIVTALLALGAGWGLSLLAGRRPGKGQARIRELENELEAARQELGDYKEEVIAQFSETARKFKTLDDSNTALHRQLAESSSLLCGAAPGPLLEAPAPREEPTLAASESEPDEQAADAGSSTTAGAAAEQKDQPTASAGAAAENAPEDIVVGEAQTETETETDERPTGAESAAEPKDAESSGEAEEPRRSAAAS